MSEISNDTQTTTTRKESERTGTGVPELLTVFESVFDMFSTHNFVAEEDV